MEDLAGVGKLADSKLVNKTYDDAVSGLARQTGKLATDIAKAMRLFLWPFQLLASSQDRLEKYLEDVRTSVPVENQVDAVPSIAGPVMKALVFLEDENPLVDLYLNLLRRAIDKERLGEAHPAFILIIEQLSPDEALFLSMVVRKELLFGTINPDTGEHGAYIAPVIADKFAYPEHASTYFDHLLSLEIIEEYSDVLADGGYVCELTKFGRLFANACIPATME
jgi:hypothetical protein